MKNQQSLYLCHMTAEEKKAYNKRYYQENKDYWREYYGVKSGVDRFKSDLQRPHTIKYEYKNDNTGTNWTHDTTYDSRSWKRFQDGLGTARSYGKTVADGWVDQGRGDGSKLKIRGSIQRERRYTPDLDARTSAIQKVQQQSARLSTPGLSQRLANMKAYTQPARRTSISNIASSAVSKGKSIVSSFASAWKLGLNSIKSAFTPKTTSTLTTKRVSTTITPAGSSGGYHFTLGPDGRTTVVRNR